jgi:oligosaccharide translocation protein RFT1
LLGLFSKTLSKLSLTLWIQDSFKYILTQGDSILISTLTSLSDQGSYALASNYGGLIARMLFQPIEESSRNLIASLCSPDQETGSPTEKGLGETKKLLTTVLRFYNLLSLIAVSIGPSLAPLLLRLVAGARWADTQAPSVLAVYCYYIPFLAINGLTEAFVAAVASSKALGSQSVSMAVFFAAFAGSAWVFLRYLGMGAQGVVWANCVNLGLRILFNIRFIKGYYRENNQVCSICGNEGRFPS